MVAVVLVEVEGGRRKEKQQHKKGGSRYPGRPGDAQVLHHLLERRRLLRLLLVVQGDFLAEFPRIVRSRHVSLLCSVFSLQWSA